MKLTKRELVAILLAMPIFLLLTGFQADTQSAFVVNLSTGVKLSGDLIDIGKPDRQWKIVNAPAGVPLGYVTVVERSRPHFVDLEPNARWISANANTNIDAPVGLYFYQTSFNVSTLQGVSLEIQGELAVDNHVVDILLKR